MSPTAAPTVLKRWRGVVVLWIAGASLQASQSLFMLHAEGNARGELRLFLVQLAIWLPWLLATPFLMHLARRHPLYPRPSARSLGLHLLALVAISVVVEGWSAGLQVAFNPWFDDPPRSYLETLRTTLIFHALNCAFTYALIVVLTHLADAQAVAARQVVEAARLNEELSRAQLTALRRQIEPHFMFNALNSIAGLVRDRRNDAAVSMIVGLSEFLRRATVDPARLQTSLADEIDYVKRYIEIQSVRFGERLRFDIAVEDGLLAAQVPNLIVQPLVENAIKHGLASRVAGGAILVSAVKRDAALSIRVFNQGPAFAPDWRERGVGLANLQARLRLLYSDAADFTVHETASEGVEVRVTLPLVWNS